MYSAIMTQIMMDRCPLKYSLSCGLQALGLRFIISQQHYAEVKQACRQQVDTGPWVWWAGASVQTDKELVPLLEQQFRNKWTLHLCDWLKIRTDRGLSVNTAPAYALQQNRAPLSTVTFWHHIWRLSLYNRFFRKTSTCTWIWAYISFNSVLQQYLHGLLQVKREDVDRVEKQD